MKSKKYWKSRAANRMFSYQQQADKVADDIAGAYIKATEQINQEVKAIFRTFQINGGLSEEEAKKLLNELPDDAKLKSLKEIVRQVKDPKQMQALLNQINSPAYAYRIKRFEQLQQDIDKQTAQLADFEQTATRAHYVDLADEAYHRVIFDIQKGTGIGFSFSRMPVSRIEAILKQNWSGKLFSERIWGRADNLNKSIQQELLAQFMTGRSYQKTAKEIEDRLAVSSMAARRLVRTESTYIANEAELESYKECGIDKFQFVATLDIRTSDICQQMDGKEFLVEEANPGTNTPPLHPWCRSTTIAVMDGVATDNLKRSARDPKTGKNYKVPADMTYQEWKKEVDNKYGKGTWESERKKLINKPVDKAQYQQYIQVLGKQNMPKTFDLFQEMKYNNIRKWKQKKREHNTIQEIQNKTWSDAFKEAAIKAYYDFLGENIEMSSHALGRFLDRKRKCSFDFDKIVRICNDEVFNYTQEDGKFIKYYDGVAVVYNETKNEVVSIISRKNPKKEWKPV